MRHKLFNDLSMIYWLQVLQPSNTKFTSGPFWTAWLHYGVVSNMSKCQFGLSSLTFLRHGVDEHGIRPLPGEVQITDFLEPTSMRKLWEFLGLVNFYRRFVPSCADLLQPLTDWPRDSYTTCCTTLSESGGYQPQPQIGMTYLLTCVDRFTRWPEAIPISDITAETVARTFIAHWVAMFGTPSTIITDKPSVRVTAVHGTH